MSTDEVKKATIERCARFAHEANRLWCLLLGDESQATWEHAEPWQKDSAFKGVVAALEGKTPRQLHESWMALMKGLLAISDVLNVPKALMSQQDAAVSVSKSMGQIGYEAYAESTNQKTFDGRDMPSWNQIREREGDEPKVTRAWEAAAAKIAEHCRDLK